MKNEFHNELYSFAKYYDIAFDFKDVATECDFLQQCLAKYAPHVAGTSFIEFAAGPALHALEMARRGLRVTAVDLSPEMRTYAQEKARRQNVKLNYICADMVRFQSEEKFDLATILMDSTSYILTNQDIIEHLRSVAQCLNDGGLYILEMSHPKNIFDITKTTVNEWEMEKEGCKVKFRWGDEKDVFDPITQITETSVVLEYNDHGHHGVLRDKAPQRCYTVTEFAALVEASGVFKIVEYFGAMKTSGVEFNNAPEAWRMIPVLKKI